MIYRRNFLNISLRQIFLLSISIIFFVLLYQFYKIQIDEFEKYNAKGSHNSLRRFIKTAPRGIIYDRNNIPIVDNRPTYSLSLIPFDAKDNFNYSLLHNITNIDSLLLKNLIVKHSNNRSKFKPQVIKNHINFKERSIIDEYKLDFPGIHFTSFPARTYPSQAKLSHVLGYLRKVNQSILDVDVNDEYKMGDVFGYAGIEKVYEKQLKGDDGVEFHVIDIDGVDHGVLKTKNDYPVISGDSLKLSIDVNMQSLSEKLLGEYKGAIICMNPYNGDIYSLVSAPTFNLDSFIGPIPLSEWEKLSNNLDNPLLNRTIQGLYPPGSVFKLILAAYALENQIVDDDWHIDCKGAMDYGDRTFKCWNQAGHGKINLSSSIINSCNIFYYNLIQKIKFSSWTKIVEDFGFGKKTGIDLPNEKYGIVPSVEYMNSRHGKWGWGKGSLLNFAIGQGDVLATPAQIIQIINAIATNGKIYRPRISMHLNPTYKTLNLSSNTWGEIKKSIYKAVNSDFGTGWRAKLNLKRGKVYGKTSTSQNPHGDTHSGFAGYIDLDGENLLSVAIIVEHGGKGSGISAEIANQLFHYYSKNY